METSSGRYLIYFCSGQTGARAVRNDIGVLFRYGRITEFSLVPLSSDDAEQVLKIVQRVIEEREKL